MLTTGILFTAGDAVAQSLFPHRNLNGELTGYNMGRSVRAWIYGSFIFAPISVKWYVKTLPYINNPFLNAAKRTQLGEKWSAFWDVTFRVALDQLTMPGLVWIPLYNTSMVALAGYDNVYSIVREKLEKNWWTVLKASWTVWPVFQLVLFLVVPVHLRVVAANCYSIGWNSFLSFIHNTPGRGIHSDHKLDNIVDLEDDDEEQEVTVVYTG